MQKNRTDSCYTCAKGNSCVQDMIHCAKNLQKLKLNYLKDLLKEIEFISCEISLLLCPNTDSGQTL